MIAKEPGRPDDRVLFPPYGENAGGKAGKVRHLFSSPGAGWHDEGDREQPYIFRVPLT